jgi:hypothetical protein
MLLFENLAVNCLTWQFFCFISDVFCPHLHFEFDGTQDRLMFTADRQRQLNYTHLLGNNSRDPIPVCRCMEKLKRIPVPRIKLDRVLRNKIPNFKKTIPM